MGSAQLVEIVWSVMAVACGYGNARIWWRALIVFFSVQAGSYRESRQIVAFDLAMTASILLSIQVLFFLVGLIAMTQPPTNPDAPTTVTSAVVASGLVLAELLLLVLAVWSERNQRRFERVVNREHAEREAEGATS